MKPNFSLFSRSLLIFVVTETVSATQLSEDRVNEIVQKIPPLIETHHVDRTRAKEIAILFSELVKSGKYQQIRQAKALAERVSEDLKEISSDGHLYLSYSDSMQISNDTLGDNDWEAVERDAEIRLNYGFTKIEVFEGNVGYLRIVEWMHPKRSLPTAVAAMKLIENTRALIIDVRGNGGGYPGIMEYILNHYFEGPPQLLSTTRYSDGETLPYTKYTSDLIQGKLMVGKPLYILVDKDTGSASEYFAYTLQSFGKALIVGSNTAGAANMNSYYSLVDNFRLSVSTASPINAKTEDNWELIGITPDISAAKIDALAVALERISAE